MMFKWHHPNRRAELATLRSGKIPFPPPFKMQDLDYTQGVEWSIVNDKPPNVRWWMNHLKFTRPLLLEATAGDIEKAAFIIRDWVVSNSEQPQSDFSWDGHATAFRAEQIACLKTHVNEDWLDRSAIQHAEFLSDPANYQGDWNHGLDQNIGLLSLGFVFQNQEWIELARARSAKAISVMVDAQGVSIEQAVGYHFYNFVRLQDAQKMFAECDAPLPPAIFERVDAMPTFLAHATMPNGKWNLLGDTVDDPIQRQRLAGTDAEFSLSRGEKGAKPVDRFKIYDGGYAFGRTGWGDARSFENESYYSLRLGPGRVIHGHNDHTSLTYYSNSESILIDGGFHGYTEDRFRAHLRSPPAHNLVYTTDRAKFSWDGETKLKEVRVENSWQNYLMSDNPYPGTERVRSVLFIQHPFELILVLDRIEGPSRRYEQAWHFSEQFAVSDRNDQIAAISANTAASLHQLWPVDAVEIVKGRDEPIQGWAGYGVFDIRPVPTVLASRAGKKVTFLTALVVQQPEACQPVSFTQKVVRNSGVSREITAQAGDRKIDIWLLENETLIVR